MAQPVLRWKELANANFGLIEQFIRERHAIIEFLTTRRAKSDIVQCSKHSAYQK